MLLPLPSNFSILYLHQAGDDTKGKQHVALLSSSDHSDIVTLGDLKEGQHLEAAANEEFYLGTSRSSQYAFTAAEAGRTATTHTPIHCTILRLSLASWFLFHSQRVNIEELDSSTQKLCSFFLHQQSRFDVESLETSTESREFRLPSEKSAHWRPLISRLPD